MDSPRHRNVGRRGTAALLLILACAVAAAACRISAIALADRDANVAPERALHRVAGHPGALLALARRQLAADRPRAAAGSARALLARSPGEGEGFEVLGLAAEAEGDMPSALRLMRIAARRGPRNLAARGWLAEQEIRRGDYRAGLEHLDAVMRFSPMHVDLLVPLIAGLARDPEFAEALYARLAENPRWRELLLARIEADSAGTAGLAQPPAASASEQVASMHLRDAIAGLRDPRGAIPAGR